MYELGSAMYKLPAAGDEVINDEYLALTVFDQVIDEVAAQESRTTYNGNGTVTNGSHSIAPKDKGY